jgi:hypothetical protein
MSLSKFLTHVNHIVKASGNTQNFRSYEDCLIEFAQANLKDVLVQLK